MVGISRNHRPTSAEYANGRVQDPTIGRFLSADPFIDGALNTQGLNRYSYVHNSPLSFVDPSGFNKSEADAHPDSQPWHDHWFDGDLEFLYTFPAIVKFDWSRYRDLIPERCSIHDPVACGWQPPPAGTANARDLPSTAGGNGTWGDFAFGAVRGAFDDAARMIIVSGAAMRILQGDFLNPHNYIALRHGWSAQILGAPDSNRGQFGYDVGPGITVLMSGGLGALRTTAARAYSVAFETIIPKVGAGTRPAHFTAANKALEAAIASDSSFAKVMQQLGITVPQRLGQSPAGWSWHHVPDQPGVVQLVPRGQHQGSAWQHLLHPNGEGGFKIWGIEF